MTIVNIIVLLLTGLSALAALFFLVRGLRARGSQPQKPYGVARQEARQDMQVNFLRAGFMLIVTLILLGVYGLVPGDGAVEAIETPTSVDQSDQSVTNTPVETLEATPTTAPATPTPVPTDVAVTTTITPTASIVAATDTPTVPTAVVNSPNGLWLREAPGGTQEVELIAHETELELLPGRETVDDLEWQQVRTPADNEGWVAAEFLDYP